MGDGPSGREFIVLDAKHRVTRQNVLDAMASAHIYHDSLRWDGRVPDRTLLLVPAVGGAPWPEDREFLRRYGVGVVAQVPGDPRHEQRLQAIPSEQGFRETLPELRSDSVPIGSEPDEVNR